MSAKIINIQNLEHPTVKNARLFEVGYYDFQKIYYAGQKNVIVEMLEKFKEQSTIIFMAELSTYRGPKSFVAVYRVEFQIEKESVLKTLETHLRLVSFSTAL